MSDKVLIIEDMPMIARGIADRLEHELQFDRENITICLSVAAAIRWLENGNKPDIIITDLCMDMDGLSQKERTEARNTRLTGLVFFRHYIGDIFKDNLAHTHVYFFTGYAEMMAKALGVVQQNRSGMLRKASEELSKEHPNTFVVSKSGMDGDYSELSRSIRANSRKYIKYF